MMKRNTAFLIVKLKEMLTRVDDARMSVQCDCKTNFVIYGDDPCQYCKDDPCRSCELNGSQDCNIYCKIISCKNYLVSNLVKGLK